jgi:arginine repressor
MKLVWAEQRTKSNIMNGFQELHGWRTQRDLSRTLQSSMIIKITTTPHYYYYYYYKDEAISVTGSGGP